MVRLRVGAVALVVLAAVWVLPPVVHQARHLCPVRPTAVREAGAIVAWARRYGVSCNACHSAGYKLTGMGQKFLRAGHQMPGTGDKESNLSEHASLTMKLRTWASSTKVEESGKEDVVTDKTSFEAHALSLYAGGPLDKGFSYFAEFYLHENEKTGGTVSNLKSESTVSDMGDYARGKLAEGYLMYNREINDDAFVTARMGRIMPWLLHFHGGGARLEYSRPLPFTSTLGGTPYRPFARQYGASVGAGFKKFFAEAGLVNGTGKYENATETETDPNKDLYLSLDYSFDDQGSMAGLYYYKGYWPTHWLGTKINGATAASGETFSQAGLLGNYTFDLKPVKGSLIAAYLLGHNKVRPTGYTSAQGYNSLGYYLEAQAHLLDGNLAPYFRWDYFDAETAAKDNEKFGPVFGLHYKPMDHGRFVLEWSDYLTRNSSTKKTKDDTLTLELQYMF